MRELPLKKTQKDKSILDLYALTGWISDKLTHNSAKTKEIIVVLERPLKLSMGSLKTYTTSVLEIGKILGMLELCFLYVKRHLLFVAPITWAKGFESSCCLGIHYHADVKRNRMHALIDEFGFDHKLFFTEQGRFMDGISDACAMLIWALKCMDDQEISSLF